MLNLKLKQNVTLDEVRKAVAQLRRYGHTPVYLRADKSCQLGCAVLRDYRRHWTTGLSQRERQDFRRFPRYAGICTADGLCEVLKERSCEIMVEHWQQLGLNRVARGLRPDVAALLRLPIPAPWIFLVIVADERMLVTVSDQLTDVNRTIDWLAAPSN